MTQVPPAVEAIGISKSFPGQQALEDVDLAVAAGDIHGLVGANGSGKSTLIKILAGYHAPGSGELWVAGKPEHHLNPGRAYDLGLRFIHQDPGVFGSLTVGENLSLGTHFGRSSALRVSWGRERSIARQALADLGLDLRIDTLTRDLPPSQRTMVAVARAVLSRANSTPVRLLVLDEPTAALPKRESDRLFDLVRSIAERGIGVLFVSHRLEEILSLTDRVTVLRDGRRVASGPTGEMSENQLVTLITGAVFEDERRTTARAPVAGGSPRLWVDGLEAGKLRAISFEIQAGEVVGIAGLLGSGRSSLARALTGAQPLDAGRIIVDGCDVTPRSSRAAIEAGVMLVPEDRAQQSLFAGLRVRENVSISRLADFQTAGLVIPSVERRRVAPILGGFDVRPRDPERRLGLLSGGNQQKVVLARWMRLSPKVLILDEPTQGIDVRAKREIHGLVRGVARKGTTILFISSDFEELALVSDRILVLRDHRLVGDIPGPEITMGLVATMAYMAPRNESEVQRIDTAASPTIGQVAG